MADKELQEKKSKILGTSKTESEKSSNDPLEKILGVFDDDIRDMSTYIKKDLRKPVDKLSSQ